MIIHESHVMRSILLATKFKIPNDFIKGNLWSPFKLRDGHMHNGIAPYCQCVWATQFEVQSSKNISDFEQSILG